MILLSVVFGRANFEMGMVLKSDGDDYDNKDDKRADEIIFAAADVDWGYGDGHNGCGDVHSENDDDTDDDDAEYKKRGDDDDDDDGI